MSSNFQTEEQEYKSQGGCITLLKFTMSCNFQPEQECYGGYYTFKVSPFFLAHAVTKLTFFVPLCYNVMNISYVMGDGACVGQGFTCKGSW